MRRKKEQVRSFDGNVGVLRKKKYIIKKESEFVDFCCQYIEWRFLCGIRYPCDQTYSYR